MKSYKNILKPLYLYALVALLWSTHAWSASYDVIHFRPDFYPSSFLSVAQPQIPQALKFYPAFYLDYAYQPLNVVNPTGAHQNMIQHLAVAHLGTSFSLTDRIAFSASAPFVFEGNFQQIGGTLKSNQWGIGSIELTSRYLLKQHEGDGVGLGLEPFIHIPSGFDDIYISSNAATGGISAIMDLVSQPYTLALHMKLHFKPEDTLGSAYSHDTFTQSIALGYQARPSFSHFFEIHTQTPLEHFFKSQDSSSIEIRYGFNYALSEKMSFVFSIGTHILPSTDSPLFRSLIGLKLPLKSSPHMAPEPPASPEISPTIEAPPQPLPQLPPPHKAERPRRFLPIH